MARGGIRVEETGRRQKIEGFEANLADIHEVQVFKAATGCEGNQDLGSIR